MKKLAFYLTLGLSALLMLAGCKKDDPSGGGDSVINLSVSTVFAAVGGGNYSVAYQIDNPVSGESVTADAGVVTWITDISVSGSSIDFYVEANTGYVVRTGTVTVSYPGAESVEFTVVQEANDVYYDYYYELTEFVSLLYDNSGTAGEDNYYTWLSDLPFLGESMQPGGHYYCLDFFVASSDGTAIPEGTYTFGGTGYGGDMVVSPYSQFADVDEETGTYIVNYFTDGTIDVSREGDEYIIQGLMTDSNDAVHLIYYKGPGEVQKTGRGIVEEEIDFTATSAFATFSTRIGNIMGVYLQLTTMETSDGYLVAPGYYLNLVAYMTYDSDGKLLPGTYNVVTDANSNLTIDQGYTTVYNGYTYYFGSYIVDYETTYLYDLASIVSGTLTIAETSDDNYTITGDFLTGEGVSVKCSYEGSLVVSGLPEGSSTLTGDYNVNLTATSGYMYFYGDYYGTGGANMVVYFVTQEGDDLEIELVTDYMETNTAGISSGTYTPAAGEPVAGEFLQGYVDVVNGYNQLYPTMYMHIDENGYYDGWAPAIDGEITFTNYGGDYYYLSFECVDDLGYTWKGSWSGNIWRMNSTPYSVSPQGITSNYMYYPMMRQDVTQHEEKLPEVVDLPSDRATRYRK